MTTHLRTWLHFLTHMATLPYAHGYTFTHMVTFLYAHDNDSLRTWLHFLTHMTALPYAHGFASRTWLLFNTHISPTMLHAHDLLLHAHG